MRPGAVSRAWFISLAVLALVACSLAPVAPKTLSQTLVYSQETATVAMQIATPLVQQHKVTPAQAQAVLDSATLVRTAIDGARLLAARGDAAGAQAQVTAIAADLRLLEDFVNRHRSRP